MKTKNHTFAAAIYTTDSPFQIYISLRYEERVQIKREFTHWKGQSIRIPDSPNLQVAGASQV
jgi:hypothetical protein